MRESETAPLAVPPDPFVAERQLRFAITHRSIVALAAPMTLAYLTTPLLGLVDTGVAGRLGDPALIGGLAVGAVIIDLVFTTFNFQRASTTGLAAQALGAGDRTECQATLFRALVLAALLGLATIAAGPLLVAAGLALMAPGETVAAAARDYFLIRMFGAPVALANYAILGWLVGIGRAGLGLAIQTLLNGVNIVLSILLGLGWQWGIAGIAWATVIAEAVTVLVGLPLCLALMEGADRPAWSRIVDLPALRRLMGLNGDIMIRSFILLAAFAFFTAQGARHGDTILAANAILMHFFLIGGYFLDGLATAAEQIAGRAIGARWREGFVRGVRLTTLWNFVLAAGLGLFFLLAGNTLIDWTTTLPQVRDSARGLLLFAALTPITGVLAFQMDGIFIGATWSRDMSMMMALSFALYLVSWAILQPLLGNVGLWLSLHVFLLARGITLALRLAPRIERTFPRSPRRLGDG